MKKIKEEFLGKRVSFKSSKNKGINIITSPDLPQELIEEIEKKWAQWVEEIPSSKVKKEQKEDK